MRRTRAPRRLSLSIAVATVLGLWLRRWLHDTRAPAPLALPPGPEPVPELPPGDDEAWLASAQGIAKVEHPTMEMDAIDLPLEDEYALVEAAEPEVRRATPADEPATEIDIVVVVDDLLGSSS